MLDIFICFESDAEAKSIKDICLKYLVQKNFDVDIILSSDTESTQKSETVLYIIEFGENFIKSALAVRKHNSQNYIIAIISGLNDLTQIVIPAIRLAGFLIKPVNEETAFSLLNGVYSDYSNSYSDDGYFRFKIKSKEFSIPIKKIILFESSNKKIILRTETQEFEFYDTLESVLSLLPNTFVRTHKSFIVNVERVSSVNYGTLTLYMGDGTEAYLSRTYKADFKKSFELLS